MFSAFISPGGHMIFSQGTKNVHDPVKFNISDTMKRSQKDRTIPKQVNFETSKFEIPLTLGKRLHVTGPYWC